MKAEMIKIPMKVESRNTLDKMHWTEKRRLRQQYQLFVRQQISHYKLKKAKKSDRYALVIVTRRLRPIRDYDNIIGGLKNMIDALVNEGFIYDDDSKHLKGPTGIKQEHAKDRDSEKTFIVRRLQ